MRYKSEANVAPHAREDFLLHIRVCREKNSVNACLLPVV